jgi:hypothetical protein
MLDDLGSESRQGQQIFFFYPKNRPERLWSVPNLLFNVYRRSFPGLKWQVREVDHSLPSSAELRMSGAMPLLPLYVFMSWTGTTSPYPVDKILINLGPASES